MSNIKASAPFHTSPEIAFAPDVIPFMPALAVIAAIRAEDDTELDACSIAHALRVALHALDIAADAHGATSFELLTEAAEAIG